MHPAYNPYQPPSNQVPAGWVPPFPAQPPPLASLWKRFLGRLIDSLLVYGSAFGIWVLTAHFHPKAPDAFLAGLMNFVFGLPVSIAQWVLIVSRGQSIGKMLLGTRIVRLNGEPLGFVHGVAMRELLLTAMSLPTHAARMIHIIDGAVILGAQRRCLHDMLAGTVVVDIRRTDRP